MIKLILSILFASILFASSPVMATETSADVGAGFSRTFLRVNGETIENLGNLTGGLTLLVGLDEERAPDGSIKTPATWGLAFGTDVLNDKDLEISRVSAGGYTDWKTIRLMANVMLGFISPGDDGGRNIVADQTNLIGGSVGLRAKANDIPFEFGGSLLKEYEGVDGLVLSDVHLNIVAPF